jgi:hypothetical protein
VEHPELQTGCGGLVLEVCYADIGVAYGRTVNIIIIIIIIIITALTLGHSTHLTAESGSN